MVAMGGSFVVVGTPSLVQKPSTPEKEYDWAKSEDGSVWDTIGKGRTRIAA